MTRWRALRVGLGTALGASAGLAFLGAFTFGDLAAPVLAGALVAGLVGLASWRLRSVAAAAALHVVAALVAFLAVVARSAPQGPIQALADTMGDGWSQLLTAVVPAPARVDLIGVAFTTVWLATATTIELDHRTRAPLLPLVPAVGVVLMAELAGPVGAGVPLLGALAVVASGVALAAIRAASAAAPAGAPPPSVGVATRRLRQTGPLLAAMIVMAAVTATVVTDDGPGQPWRLRAAAREALDEPAVLHPLAGLAAAYRDRPDDPDHSPDAVVARITLDRPTPASVDADGETVLHLPMAAYDRYDGVTWRSSEPHRPVGSTLPEELVRPARRTTQRIEQRIEVVDLDGPWLPTLTGPRHADGGDPLLHDALAGTLATAATPRPGTVFDVRSDVPVLDASTDADTVPGTPPGPVDFTVVANGEGDLEPDLGRVRQVARQLFATPQPYPQQLQALTDLFQNRRPDVAAVLSVPTEVLERGPDLAFAWPQADADGSAPTDVDVNAAVLNETPTGHGIGRVNTFLYLPQADGRPAPNAGLGTPEQFATAATLIARAQGIPARLVVGYTVPYDGATSFDVHRGDADAWVEVWSPDGGWHPLDTAPTPLGVAALEPTTTTSSTGSTTTIAGSASSSPPVAVTTGAPTDRGATTSGLDRLATVLGAGLALAVVMVLGSALAVRARRRGRARGTAADRLSGAWDEALHTLQLAGVPVDESHSAAEVGAATSAATLPVEDLQALARIVLRGAHGPGEPTPSDAGMAWHHERRLRHQVARSSAMTTRLSLRLDPRRVLHPMGPVPAPAPPARGGRAGRRPETTGPRPGDHLEGVGGPQVDASRPQAAIGVGVGCTPPPTTDPD